MENKTMHSGTYIAKGNGSKRMRDATEFTSNTVFNFILRDTTRCVTLSIEFFCA